MAEERREIRGKGERSKERKWYGKIEREWIRDNPSVVGGR